MIMRVCPNCVYSINMQFAASKALGKHPDVCYLVVNDKHATVIVASEPLTEEPGWQEVPRNHLVLIHPDHRAETRGIKQIS